MSARTFHVPPDAAGERLDVVMATRLPGVSRRGARRMIDDGLVFVDGHRVRTQGRPLRAGAEIRVEEGIAGASDASRDVAAARPLPILYEDDALIVVDKPSGMPTEPTRQGSRGTVLDTLQRQRRESGLRAVHRLDVDTTGVLLFARSSDAMARFSAMFASGDVERTYGALVRGVPDFATRSIELSLAAAPDAHGRVRVDDAGRVCRTDVDVRMRGEAAAWLRVVPRTGRMHQIRVHLAAIGLPLVGDRRYDPAHAVIGCLGLHAESVVIDGRTFRAPPPPSLRDVARGFGLMLDDVHDAPAPAVDAEPTR